MRNFSNISRCSLRPEYHEEVEDRPLRLMKVAAHMLAFTNDEPAAIAYLEGSQGASNQEAFLAVKAANVLLNTSHEN